MSRLNRFLGKEKELIIDGEVFKVHPLKVKDLNLFSENMTKEEQTNASKEILKRSFPEEGFTDEELENIDIQTFTKFMTAVNDVNGFNEQDGGIRKIKEKIVQAGTQ